jgi:cytochrome c-type biogenesis protein CcmE
MTRKQKRLAVIGGGMSFIVAAVLLVMFAFSNSVAYFYMPADLASNPVPPGTRIRLGGLGGGGRGGDARGGEAGGAADERTGVLVLGRELRAADMAGEDDHPC